MQDALNFLQFALNGLSPVFVISISIGLALSISHGLINMYKGF